MVQVNATRFATEKGIFFAVDKAGFEEIRFGLRVLCGA